MGAQTIPPAAAGKVRFITTLLSGTTYTVPAGVTSLNVCLFGGGGGGSAAKVVGSQAVDGSYGAPGQVIRSIVSTTPGAVISYGVGGGGAANSTGGTTTFTGATSAAGGNGAATNAATGSTGTQAGAQHNGGNGGGGNTTSSGGAGGTGGAGKIDVEYWV